LLPLPSLLLFLLSAVISPQPLTLSLLLALSIAGIDVDCRVVFSQHVSDMLAFWNVGPTLTQNLSSRHHSMLPTCWADIVDIV
jgi:hypothetical protein